MVVVPPQAARERDVLEDAAEGCLPLRWWWCPSRRALLHVGDTVARPVAGDIAGAIALLTVRFRVGFSSMGSGTWGSYAEQGCECEFDESLLEQLRDGGACLVLCLQGPGVHAFVGDVDHVSKRPFAGTSDDSNDCYI